MQNFTWINLSISNISMWPVFMHICLSLNRLLHLIYACEEKNIYVIFGKRSPTKSSQKRGYIAFTLNCIYIYFLYWIKFNLGIICWFLPLFCYVSGLLISSLGEENSQPRRYKYRLIFISWKLIEARALTFHCQKWI